jgi:hypothetical protein
MPHNAASEEYTLVVTNLTVDDSGTYLCEYKKDQEKTFELDVTGAVCTRAHKCMCVQSRRLRAAIKHLTTPMTIVRAVVSRASATDVCLCAHPAIFSRTSSIQSAACLKCRSFSTASPMAVGSQYAARVHMNMYSEHVACTML